MQRHRIKRQVNHGTARLCLVLALGLRLSTQTSIGLAAEESEVPVLPNLELIEFLGSFSTDDGEWIDPESLLEEDFPALLKAAARMRPDLQQDEDSDDGPGGNDSND